MQTLDFYFDFISPYGYFAASVIDKIGEKHGIPVAWRAFNMRSVVSKKMGITQPIFAQPLKGPYFQQDVPRMARWFGLPMNPANIAEFNPVPAERAFWVLHDQDPALAKAFAVEVYRLVFAAGIAPSQPGEVAEIARQLGADGEQILQAIQGDAAKQRLVDETENAVAAGVWGTPTFKVDDQLFWGSDRLWMVDEWLARGGW
jgi:2-hydroxychromene-2-carboxylate isomerase